MTTTAQPRSDHGTLSRYKHYGCRCTTCTDAYRAYQRTYNRKRAYGTWQPYVDAEPVRQHIQALRGAGIGIDRIAEHAGLNITSVSSLIYDLGSTHPRRKRIRPETAATLLAIRAQDIQPGVVDATGTHRRIQALAAAGWPLKPLGPYIGVAPATVRRILTQRKLYATTANKTAAAYQRLWNARPEDHGILPASSARARRYAARQGWPDPQYWDDMGHIDDPAFDPAPSKPSRDQLAAGRRAEIQHLAGFGTPANEIAERLDMAVSTVNHILLELRTGTRRDRQAVAA